MINYKPAVDKDALYNTLDFLSRQRRVRIIMRESSLNLRELLLIQLIFAMPDMEISAYAEKLSVSLSSVSMMMTSFVNQGLVKQSGEKADRRKVVRLTTKGVMFAHSNTELITCINEELTK